MAFGITPRQPGALSMTAMADPLDAIPEADETDNEATDTFTVRPPDCSITLTGTPWQSTVWGASMKQGRNGPHSRGSV